jgi:glutamate-1-semialdehyde 2,1-aminomutase
MSQSEQLLQRATEVIPGGVNSPVRAFRAVGGQPRFLSRAEGPRVWDEDGHSYLDFVLSWGPAILGHACPDVVQAAQQAVARGSSFGAPTRLEVELAELTIERVPGLEMLRLVSSGTEACLSALRLARGVTGRDRLIKFKGCYHGHGDAFLAAAGSGALTLSLPDSPGVTAATAADTLLATFNDLDSVDVLLQAHRGSVAAIIVEPVCGNTGCIPPEPGFLEGLRERCSEDGVLLLFDEVMTGFRLGRGGAAARFGVTPDLYTFGKVLGGGFPLAAFGGRKEHLEQIAPQGPIYQAGTLSGNPVAVAAGLCTLQKLTAEAYATLDDRSAFWQAGVEEILQRRALPLTFQRVGSMFTLFFRPQPVRNAGDALDCDRERFGRFFHALLRRGVYFAPSPFEAGFLSTTHSEAILADALEKLEDALREAFDQP